MRPPAKPSKPWGCGSSSRRASPYRRAAESPAWLRGTRPRLALGRGSCVRFLAQESITTTRRLARSASTSHSLQSMSSTSSQLVPSRRSTIDPRSRSERESGLGGLLSGSGLRSVDRDGRVLGERWGSSCFWTIGCEPELHFGLGCDLPSSIELTPWLPAHGAKRLTATDLLPSASVSSRTPRSIAGSAR
jgi:hypothetical protein